MSASDRSSELRLPTQAIAVRIALVGSAPAHAEMFVADSQRPGRSHLLDDLAIQLASDTSFVPVRWSNRIRLFGKHAIAWVAALQRGAAPEVSTDFSPEPSDELRLFDRVHPVELELAGGAKLIGTLLDSLPADRTRVIDHLNRAGRFQRLWTSDEHYLVNTQQIVAVTELGKGR